MRLTLLLTSLATFIEQHELPEPSCTINPPGYVQLYVENLRDLRAWASAFNATPRTQYVAGGSGPFVAYTTAGLIDGVGIDVAYYDRDSERVAKLAPQAVTA